MLPGGRAGAGSGLVCRFQRTARRGSGRLAQDAQVAPAGPFGAGWGLQCSMGAALRRLLLRLDGQCPHVPDRIGQGEQVIRARLVGCGRHGQPQHLPAPGHRKGVCVLLAEIVAMRLSVGGQGAEDSGGVCIHVRQGGHR
jgi:hypothetical protein